MQTTHDTLDKRTLAEQGLILKCRVGSSAYGVSTEASDRDEMGICLEPREYVTGLKTFEQWNHHSAGENEDGTTKRSGEGDLDITIYSARKFLRLFMNGNPSIIEMLHVSENDIIDSVPIAEELIENRKRLRGPAAGKRYLGYVRSQKDALVGKRSTKVNRPELVAAHGYDTKFAGHAIRLCLMGIEYVKTGELTLPMPLEQRGAVLAVRAGTVDFETFLLLLDKYEQELLMTVAMTHVPPPDWDWANDWLHRAHEAYWASW